MSNLTTAQATLSGKTSKLTLSQEASSGSLHPNYKDPDIGLVVTGSIAAPIRFSSLQALNDFLASTGPNGKWPV